MTPRAAGWHGLSSAVGSPQFTSQSSGVELMTGTAGIMDFAIGGAGWYAVAACSGSGRMTGDTGGGAADGSTVVRLGQIETMAEHTVIGRGAR